MFNKVTYIARKWHSDVWW